MSQFDLEEELTLSTSIGDFALHEVVRYLNGEVAHSTSMAPSRLSWMTAFVIALMTSTRYGKAWGFPSMTMGL